jgi:hypothetical protein
MSVSRRRPPLRANGIIGTMIAHAFKTEAQERVDRDLGAL